MSWAGWPPTIDDRDLELFERRRVALDKRQGPRVGDFVIFPDGTERRITYVWEWEDHQHAVTGEHVPAGTSIQTGNLFTSYYLGDGYVSYSGSLYLGVPGETLTLTDKKQLGDVGCSTMTFDKLAVASTRRSSSACTAARSKLPSAEKAHRSSHWLGGAGDARRPITGNRLYRARPQVIETVARRPDRNTTRPMAQEEA